MRKKWTRFVRAFSVCTIAAILSACQEDLIEKQQVAHEVGFYAGLAKEALTKGADKVSDALLTGQYEYPNGVYYGGNGDEISTAYLKSVFVDCLNGEYEVLSSQS